MTSFSRRYQLPLTVSAVDSSVRTPAPLTAFNTWPFKRPDPTCQLYAVVVTPLTVVSDFTLQASNVPNKVVMVSVLNVRVSVVGTLLLVPRVSVVTV